MTRLNKLPPGGDPQRSQAQALELAARITAQMSEAARRGRQISPVQALAELEAEAASPDEMTLARRLAERIGAHIEAAARQGRQVTSAQAAIELGIKPGEVLQARHQRRS